MVVTGATGSMMYSANGNDSPLSAKDLLLKQQLQVEQEIDRMESSEPLSVMKKEKMQSLQFQLRDIETQLLIAHRQELMPESDDSRQPAAAAAQDVNIQVAAGTIAAAASLEAATPAVNAAAESQSAEIRMAAANPVPQLEESLDSLRPIHEKNEDDGASSSDTKHKDEREKSASGRRPQGQWIDILA